jgi:hypothetical protein
LDAVVEALEIPEFLEEMQERSVRVRGVLGVHGSLVVDQGVRRDPRRDQEGRHTHTETREVVGDVVAVREAGEGYAILGSGNVCWGRDVVGKATVLVEVDDQKTAREKVES